MNNTTDNTSRALDSSLHPLTRAKAVLAMVHPAAREAMLGLTVCAASLCAGWYGAGALLAAAPADTHTSARAA